jgi:Ras-related protein Rab-11A
MSYDYSYKIIFAGSVGVGKTSLIQKITSQDYNHELYSPTIGVEFNSIILKINDKNIKCRLWDTAGQETYNSLINVYFREITGAVLVFDSHYQESLNDIENIWIPQLKKNNIGRMPKIILVENKSDLKRDINNDILQDIINKYDLLYIKTSVLHNTNTKDILMKLCNYIDGHTDYGSLYEIGYKNIKSGYKDFLVNSKKSKYLDMNDNRDWCCKIC